MKKLVLAVSVLGFGSVFGAMYSPNTYRCMDESKDVSISYVTGNIRGKMELGFQDKSNKLSTHQVGDAITVEKTVLGNLITATIPYDRRIMDAPMRHVSLVVPTLNLTTENPKATFSTYVILSYSSGFKPVYVPAQHISKIVAVECTALSLKY